MHDHSFAMLAIMEKALRFLNIVAYMTKLCVELGERHLYINTTI